MAKPKTYSGGCLCDKIRFEAQGPAQKPHTCSCNKCQRHSGALTTAWVEFPRHAVKWSAQPATWRSSAITSRAFCPTCGSALGAINDAPTVGLLLGVFDKPNEKELMPTAHSYKVGRPKWWCVGITSETNSFATRMELADKIIEDNKSASKAGPVRRANAVDPFCVALRAFDIPILHSYLRKPRSQYDSVFQAVTKEARFQHATSDAGELFF